MTQAHSERVRVVREARRAMGTRFEVVLVGSDPVRLQAAAEAVLDEVERLEAQLSCYRPQSELSGINAFAAERPVRVEPRLFALLRQALEIAAATGGAFDPTVAPLLRAWGFVGGAGQPPDADTLARAREVTGAHGVELDAEGFTLRFIREGMSLDLGAIGKGYALDRAREVLEESCCRAGLLHAGTSTVYAFGSPPESPGGWRVGLRDPARGERETLGEVELTDRALSVSAPHGKAFREGEALLGHVLDPRTGEPTQAGRLAAVLHPSATTADALSTALLVLGRGGLAGLEAAFPEAAFLVVTDEGTATAGREGWHLKVGGEGCPPRE
jgi:FAD:protein FMN transferase